MKYYEKVGFTGSWYEDGEREVGYRCGHKHRTSGAAEACRSHCDYGQGSAVRKYDTEKPRTYEEV